MKPAIYLFQPLAAGATWQQTLRRLGTDSESISDPEGLLSLCRSAKPGILFADRKLLSDALVMLSADVTRWTSQGGAVVITGTSAATPFPFPVEELGECRDPLILNDLLLRYFPDYSRRLPRIDTKLPGLFFVGKNSQLCEILSIGPGGAFIKTGASLPETGTIVRIIIALMGMRKEIELEANVVRHVLPNEYNNYQQGFGVCFIAADPALLADLGEYMKNTVCDADAPLSFSPAFYPARREEEETKPQDPAPDASPSRGREKGLTRIH
jgi:hypothetical protein